MTSDRALFTLKCLVDGIYLTAKPSNQITRQTTATDHQRHQTKNMYLRSWTALLWGNPCRPWRFHENVLTCKRSGSGGRLDPCVTALHTAGAPAAPGAPAGGLTLPAMQTHSHVNSARKEKAHTKGICTHPRHISRFSNRTFLFVFFFNVIMFQKSFFYSFKKLKIEVFV